MKSAARAGLWLGLVVACAGALAAHVTDKLAVGLYAGLNDPAPARILTSGTPLERLDSSGGQCRVRLGDGEQGWLECRYITDEKPARAMLVEAQAAAGRLRNELAGVKAELAKRHLDAAGLQRRLQAVERLWGDKTPVQPEAAPAAAPILKDVSQAELSIAAGEHSVPLSFGIPAGLLSALGGALVGLLLGAVLFYWRCRRRYGGLRF